MPRRRILLDACVAINLAATDSLQDIAETLQITFVVAAQAEAEVGYLRDIIDGDLTLSPINLRQYAPDGIVEILSLSPTELALYVELAELVDDDEAATIAMAIVRGLDMATDDRRARRLCHERELDEPMRTVGLLRAYADAACLTDERIRRVIIKIRDRASFQPPRSDPDLKWWNENAIK